MSPDQSRDLKPGQRVRWMEDSGDMGTIIERDWSAVQIKWDSGKEQTCHHNEMENLTLVP